MTLIEVDGHDRKVSINIQHITYIYPEKYDNGCVIGLLCGKKIETKDDYDDVLNSMID